MASIFVASGGERKKGGKWDAKTRVKFYLEKKVISQ